jgi:hypothetical protein
MQWPRAAGTSGDPHFASTEQRMAQRAASQVARKRAKAPQAVYTLEVRLIGGPVTESFAQANPTVSRTIQIAGNQTLEHLHQVLYRALDREEEHLYEFQLGGKKPHDRHARSYGHPMSAREHNGEPGYAESVRGARIDSLGLKTRSVFFYWFDFGDDWWHRIKVVRIEDTAPGVDLPRVIERVGESPPQYPFAYEDFEDDDEDEGLASEQGTKR